MSMSELLRFVTASEAIVEPSSWGPHEWLCRPGLTDAKQLQVVRVSSLPATLRTSIRLGKVKVGTGRKASISGRVVKASADGIAGKVRVYWQQKRGKAWKTIHSGLKPANKPFTFKQKLKRTGTWRVQVKYVNVAPYKPSTAMSKRFTVKH